MSVKFMIITALVCGLSSLQLKAQQTAKITPSGIGFLEYRPEGYNTNSNDYPIVIFLHGIGEKGTTSTDPATLTSSVWKVANVGLPKYIKYGKQYPFLMIAPQLKSSYNLWTANYVMDVFNYVKTYLRIEERRIYITGLSLGGFGTWTTLAAYPKLFAAAVPICSGGSALSKACGIAAENVALWAFHGTSDNVVSYTVTTRMIDAVNACSPKPNPLAKYTLFPGMGHNVWDKTYNETSALNWMLSFTNGTTATSTTTTTTTNIAPVASAGADRSTSSSSITLNGSGTDKDGKIVAYKWTQYGGAATTMTNATTPNLAVTGLKDGKYYFRLTVTDDKGATDYDNTQVAVSGSTGTTSTGTSTTNVVPVAYAGPDRTTSSTSITLNGSGTDKDGSIVSYKWIQYGGAATSMSNATSPNLGISGLRDGKYYFRLTVTDDKGATDYDNTQVVVSGSTSTATSTTTTTNVVPVAYAGPDRTTNSTSITLNGSGTDKDGSIVSYKWIQYGGAATTMSNATSPTLGISGLRDGKYYFRLTVTDDRGATDYDNTQVVVSGSSTSTTTASTATSTSNIVPVAYAGADRRISSTSVTLNGSGTDKDGRIVSYRWTQYGGTAATMSNTTTPNLSLSGLRDGKYYFRLTVWDDAGASDYDNTLVVVSGSTTASTTTTTTGNALPEAYAGPDLRLGDVNSVIIHGSGVDRDGNIVSYKWVQYGGEQVSLTNPSSATPTVSGLDPGKYYFKLTVKDDDGATDYDRMLIVINES